MKGSTVVSGLLAATFLTSSPVFAAQDGDSVTAHVALTSNYVYRGLTLSDDNLAVQGGIDWQQGAHRGWYAGLFSSTVDNGVDDGFEIDLYGGYKGSFGNSSVLGYEVGAIIYEYTDSQLSDGESELLLGISYESAYLKLFFGDNSNLGAGSYTYIDAGAAFLVMNDLDLDVHLGHFSSDWAKDATDISATLSTEISGVNLGLTATYIDESATGSETEFLVTVTKEFDL